MLRYISITIIGVLIVLTGCVGEPNREQVIHDDAKILDELKSLKAEYGRLRLENEAMSTELQKEIGYSSPAFITGKAFEGGDYTAVWGITLKNIWQNVDGVEKVVVTGIMPHFPAHLSGIQVGDRIVKFNGVDVINKMHLSNLIREIPLGKTEIQVTTIDKQGTEKSLTSFVLFIDVLGFDKYVDESRKAHLTNR